MPLCPGLGTTPRVGRYMEAETDRWVHRWKSRWVMGWRSAHPAWFPLSQLAGLGQIPWGWGDTEGWVMPGHPQLSPGHEPAAPRQAQVGPHHVFSVCPHTVE